MASKRQPQDTTAPTQSPAEGRDDRVPSHSAALEEVARRFSVVITPAMRALADQSPGVAAQFLPDVRELAVAPDERHDPIGDGAHSPVPGVVHRYPDRVLLQPTQICRVHCRYCFRRELLEPSGSLSPQQLADAIAYIRDHPEIWEVILTGGDPLVLSPRRLGALLEALDGIDHVEVLRLHSRVPVVAPESVTDGLLAVLRRPAKAVWLVVHVNHPDELTAEARAALGRLADAGVPLLAQTVLLRGVNDTPEVLERLLRRLVAARVKPYYLHHLDRARGTGHFRTSLEAGQALVRALRGRVSGLCQPDYVLDIPGGHGKVPVGPSYLERDRDGGWRVRDPQGRCHSYGG